MENLNEKLNYFQGKRQEIIKLKQEIEKKTEEYKAEEAAYFGPGTSGTIAELVELFLKITK